MVGAETRKGVVLVLMPVGRDAATVAGLIERTGLRAVICHTVRDVVDHLERIVDVVLVAEEALYGSNANDLKDWVDCQPQWSDQPFIVLTNHNEGPKFAAFRRELVLRLRNVNFLERPLQTITLQATVISAERARSRQYETRAYLEAQRGVAVELERLVAERTAELEQANTKLREEIAGRERAQAALLQAQKIEALGQLVGGVAHDFNNLLMAVIGNLDLLSKKLGEDARLHRLLDGAMEGARRGATLTQRLLAFARKQELKAQATDVRSLVENMIGLIDRSVGPMVRIELRAEDKMPVVDVDPNQLEMALLNLAVNARDAMITGGVLTIELSEQIVEVYDQLGVQPGRYVVLSVQDTGEGMDTETLARAVEPFFSTKGVGKGTGLGLSMVFGLAQQSGGALRLESAPSSGTTARLWLPVATETTLPSGRTPNLETKASGRARILFVDDDLLIAGSTVDLLEDLGHQVIEAHSAIEALRLLESGLAADLLITDHAMPGMTGIELAREVRRQYPRLPILLATGFAELEGSELVDVARLAKPYTQAQLATEIAHLLPHGRNGF
ncbi:ATP-binding protein [Bradyrhizobium erythrophlei]|uniref:histidine kinase n=1 Tax=Bradyrhizobium erythrophlei TaxID=1437360 RepID=A0A1H4YD81_9BRAD|nr:ATP-binding protein [Bradyrhizobium erythrophlei]SED15942.1 His Kinase A (phospho-acceptor) domain-containing protein [Bradyrhizobium erythrophlei]